MKVWLGQYGVRRKLNVVTARANFRPSLFVKFVLKKILRCFAFFQLLRFCFFTSSFLSIQSTSAWTCTWTCRSCADTCMVGGATLLFFLSFFFISRGVTNGPLCECVSLGLTAAAGDRWPPCTYSKATQGKQTAPHLLTGWRKGDQKNEGTSREKGWICLHALGVVSCLFFV